MTGEWSISLAPVLPFVAVSCGPAVKTWSILIMTNEEAQERNQYFTVSQYKLGVMYVLTLGMYGVYWFYKNWKLQQPFVEKRIFPVLRAIFNIFFTHSLFARIRDTAGKKNIVADFNYKSMATVYVVLMVVGNVIGQFEAANAFGTLSIIGMIMFMLALYPLYKVQGVVNKINDDPYGVFNNELTLANYVFIAIGLLLWFFIVMAVLLHCGVLQVDA